MDVRLYLYVTHVRNPGYSATLQRDARVEYRFSEYVTLRFILFFIKFINLFIILVLFLCLYVVVFGVFFCDLK